MSDLNLPADEQADHSGPIADPDDDAFGPPDDEQSAEPARGRPGAIPPPD